MATALTAPGSSDEVTFISFPIEKFDEDPQTGTLYVYGKATSPDLDSDEQVADGDWSAKAMETWFSTGPNVRVMHNSTAMPAGSGVKIEINRDGDQAHWVKAAVDEPNAKLMVKRKHLRAFSIGITKPLIVRDPTGRARGGIIKGGEIAEISLVDRPANRSCYVEIAKAASDGTCEFTGKIFGADDLLAKAAHDDDMVNVDLPKAASISISPADFAKLRTFKQQLTREQPAGDAAALEAVKAAEAHVYKRDIDTATRRRLAKEGKALPDGSYPIDSVEDLHNAAVLARSGHGDVAAAKRLIARRAKELGVPNPLKGGGRKGGGDEAGKGDGVSGQPRDGAAAGADGPVLAKAAPDAPDGADGEGGLRHDDGQDDDTDSDADALDKAAAKPGKAAKDKPGVSCGNCGKKCGPRCRFCPGCGRPVKASARAEKAAGAGAGDAVAAPPETAAAPGTAAAAAEAAGDPACEVKAAARHRSLGVPYDSGWLHDVLCPAYDPGDVARHYPRRDLSLVDEYAWQAKALDLAACAPLEQARTAMDLWRHARTLKALPADVAASVAAEAHKAFRDANPGPASAPTPGEMPASRFRRPLITAGHAAPSPGQDPPHVMPGHPGHLDAASFTRGPLTAGHAADSPGNTAAPAPVPAPAVPGVPSAVSDRDIQRRNAAQAMSAMHDHIAASFPDLCPMHGPGAAGQPPDGARPVAAPAGAPGPRRARKNAGKDTRKAAAVKAGRLERKLRRARKAAGIKAEPALLKYAAPHRPAAPALDAAALEQVITKAQAPLLDKLAAQQDTLTEHKRVLDAIADQPDPRVAAYRTAVLPQTPVPAVPGPAPAGYEDRVRANVLSTMYDQWRNSASPELREEAWKFLLKDAGIDMTKNT